MGDLIFLLFCFCMLICILALQSYIYTEANGHGNQEWLLGIIVLVVWSYCLFVFVDVAKNMIS